MTQSLLPAARRSYYSGTLAEFCAADRDEIFARMARQNDFDLTGTQRDAWLEQAAILVRAVSCHPGSIYLEFTIPRMGRRIDAVVIIGPVIFVLAEDLNLMPGHGVDHSSPFPGWRASAACPEKSVGSEPWVTRQNFRKGPRQTFRNPQLRWPTAAIPHKRGPHHFFRSASRRIALSRLRSATKVLSCRFPSRS